LQLIQPGEWNKEVYRQHVRSALQRKIFFGMRYYLPFINMNVTYDNQRLRDELGDECPPLPAATDYLGSLLEMITMGQAVEELALP
jgi:tagatose-1,6-bisphosphate aldolase non-catalytic subunit AgaZ/GatZ